FSTTTSLAAEAAESFEAVGSPPFKDACPSSFVIRPFLPEPVTALMLSSFSRDYLRNTGIALTVLFSSTSSV
ncbi:hypothetical protein FC03_15040, partial [Staphylococcus aureus]